MIYARKGNDTQLSGKGDCSCSICPHTITQPLYIGKKATAGRNIPAINLISEMIARSPTNNFSLSYNAI